MSDFFRKCAIGKIVYETLSEAELLHFWKLYQHDFLAMVYKRETDDQREIEVIHVVLFITKRFENFYIHTETVFENMLFKFT